MIAINDQRHPHFPRLNYLPFMINLPLPNTRIALADPDKHHVLANMNPRRQPLPVVTLGLAGICATLMMAQAYAADLSGSLAGAIHGHRAAEVTAHRSPGLYTVKPDWYNLDAADPAENRLTIAFPEGRTLSLARERLEHGALDGVSTWIGHNADEGPLHSAILSYNASHTAVFGVVYGHGTVYQVSTDAGGVVTMRDLKTGGLRPIPPVDDAVMPETLAAARLAAARPVGPRNLADQAAMRAQQDRLNHIVTLLHSTLPSPAPSGVTEQVATARDTKSPEATGTSAAVTIDVTVLYTTSFAQQLGEANVPTRIASLFALANQALVNSKVAASYRVVGLHEVDYPDNDIHTALSDTFAFSGALAPARAWKEQDGADLVTLIRPYNPNFSASICGIAEEGGTADIDQQLSTGSMSVVDVGGSGSAFCDDTSLAHELGHNLGGQHDVAHAQGQGAYPFSYGYGVSDGTVNSWGDIMSYIWPHLTIFANPNLNTCNGYACGTATGDVARTFNLTAPIVATFRATKQSDPGFYSVSGNVIDQYGQPYPEPITVTPSDGTIACSTSVTDYPNFNRFNCSVPLGASGTLAIADKYDPSSNSTSINFAPDGNTSNTITFKNLNEPTVSYTINLQSEVGLPVSSSTLSANALSAPAECVASTTGFTCYTNAGMSGFPQISDPSGTYWDSADPAFSRITDSKTFTFVAHPAHAQVYSVTGSVTSTSMGTPFIPANMVAKSTNPAATCTNVIPNGYFACWVPPGSSGTLSLVDPLGRTFTGTQASYSNITQNAAGSWAPTFTTGPTQSMPMIGAGSSGPQTARMVGLYVDAALEDAGTQKNIYVAAAVPGTSTLFFLTYHGWVPWTNGPLPVYISTTQDKSLYLPVVGTPLDLTSVNGTVVFAGEATSDADLLNNHKYMPIYRESR